MHKKNVPMGLHSIFRKNELEFQAATLWTNSCSSNAKGTILDIEDIDFIPISKI
jgi:hypothetical protein